MRGSFLLVLALILTFTQPPVYAPPYSAGVRTGDWANYAVSGDQAMNVVRSNITVIQIIGTNVTVRSTDVYVDGTASSEILWIDVSTGQNNTARLSEPLFFFVILPGRGIGQHIYGSQSSLIIQNSLDRTYVQASRRTNFGNITLVGTGSTAYYWDAQTGILSEILQLHQNQTVGIHALLVSTSLWSPQPPSYSTIFLEVTLIAVVGAVGAILAYSRLTRGRKRKRSGIRNGLRSGAVSKSLETTWPS
jgi:hypothetical protein